MLPQPPDFDLVFDRLKTLLAPYAARLDASGNGPFYSLDTRHILEEPYAH